jgi:APA family basic amino acid/polyamine antiporter
LHPALGYLAGWGSLLVGFAAPIAAEALAAGNFANAVWSRADPRIFALALIGLLTLSHIAGWNSSRWTQDLLAVIKVVLVVGFAIIGLALGNNHWPQWLPPNHPTGFPAEPFVSSLFYIAFAFSGWNSAVYAAEEFRNPRRDVPRAMLIGTAAVGVLYLVVNWIFVANLSPAEASVVFEYETRRVTLGHAIAKSLVGAGGATSMSLIIILLFSSAISAMTFVGPRVYSAMAADGLLPKVFAGTGGRLPVASVLLQNGLAAGILLTHDLRQVLENVGAILTLFAALTALSLFKVRLRKAQPHPSLPSLAAAGVYTLSAAWMLFLGFRKSLNLLGWVALMVSVALIAYATTTFLRRRNVARG